MNSMFKIGKRLINLATLAWIGDIEAEVYGISPDVRKGGYVYSYSFEIGFNRGEVVVIKKSSFDEELEFEEARDKLIQSLEAYNKSKLP